MINDTLLITLEIHYNLDMSIKEIRSDLKRLADKDRAVILQRFFKTGPGEYGEGDKFIGVRVPDIRKIANKYRSTSRRDVLRLLNSAIHEERLLAILLLVREFSEGDEEKQKEIYDLYLENTGFINSWDLVDVSAEHIVGAYLFNKSRKPLYELVRSDLLWDKRISVMATFHFIRRDEFDETIRIAKILLSDSEDLIHKAVGWMLREVGKRHLETEEAFLKANCRNMPRTMLRYAIEKFPESKRQRYLKGRIR
jgi:3-methyladenine DNA glycosylase AlkD